MEGQMDTPTRVFVDREALYVALHLLCGIDGRYHLRMPFRRGDYAYATNAIVVARVAARLAPWVIEREYTPDPSSQAWDRSLYAAKPTLWPKLPRVKVSKCGCCSEGDRKYSPCNVWELKHAEHLVACPTCGMLNQEEESNHVTLGQCVFNVRTARRVASIGGVMFAPLTDDGKRPWYWTVDDLGIKGLLMPVATEAEFLAVHGGKMA